MRVVHNFVYICINNTFSSTETQSGVMTVSIYGDMSARFLICTYIDIKKHIPLSYVRVYPDNKHLAKISVLCHAFII